MRIVVFIFLRQASCRSRTLRAGCQSVRLPLSLRSPPPAKPAQGTLRHRVQRMGSPPPIPGVLASLPVSNVQPVHTELLQGNPAAPQPRARIRVTDSSVLPARCRPRGRSQLEESRSRSACMEPWLARTTTVIPFEDSADMIDDSLGDAEFDPKLARGVHGTSSPDRRATRATTWTTRTAGED